MPYYAKGRNRGVRRRKPYKKRAYKSAVNVKKLSKQVLRIKNDMKRQNEVKELTPVDIYANTVGQVDANNSGARVFNLSAMSMPSGVNDGERIGIKVKLIGMSFRFQLNQQAVASLANRIIIDFYRTPDFQSADANLRDQLYDTDSISGVVDANSTRNHPFIKSKFNPTGIHELIGSKSVYVRRDDVTGQSHVMDFKYFIKQNTILHYNGPSTQVPQNYRFFIVCRAQTGNRSGTTASTLPNLPTGATETGVLLRFQTTCYYVDM